MESISRVLRLKIYYNCVNNQAGCPLNVESRSVGMLCILPGHA